MMRLKLKESVETLLDEVCRGKRISDVDYVRDLYALMRLGGNGIPSEPVLTKIIDAYGNTYSDTKTGRLMVRIVLAKRRSLFNRLVKTAMFAHRVQTRKHLAETDLEVLERWLGTAFIIGQKRQVAVCTVCKLASSCKFFAYTSSIDVTVLTPMFTMDPEITKLIHADCPQKPKPDAASALEAVADTLDEIAQAGEVAGSVSQEVPANLMEMIGKAQQEATKQHYNMLGEIAADLENNFTGIDTNTEDSSNEPVIDFQNGNSADFRASHTFTSGNPVQLVSPDAINKISVTQLVILRLAMKLDSAVGKRLATAKKTNEFTTRKKQSKMERVSDLPQVNSAAHALPDDVLDARIAKRDLVRRHNEKPETKSQLIAIVLDASFSMRTFLGGTVLGPVLRSTLAQCFTLAICRRACLDSGMIFFRTFSGSVTPIIEADSPDTFDNLMRVVASVSFDGGSTNIDHAMTTTLKDIDDAKGRLSEAELLLITDGLSEIGPAQMTEIKRMAKDVSISTLHIIGEPQARKPEIRKKEIAQIESCSRSMREMSDFYYAIDPRSQSIDDMVKLVGNKKPKH